jgi:acetyl esterase/lipase
MRIPCFALATAFMLQAQTPPEPQAPVERTYATVAGTALKAYVFAPKGGSRPRPAVALFHGGGWDEGEAAWTFAQARRLADRGMVAVAIEYRLSDRKTITPLDAMADARAALRWMRSHAAELGLDPTRVAALGYSAGGHLAACAALFTESDPKDGVSCVPDALVLWSPAIAVAGSHWMKQLLLGRACPLDISPVDNLRRGLPPTLIIQGTDDDVTPFQGAKAYAELVKKLGGQCQLETFPGYGHMLTPAQLQDDSGIPHADPKAVADARERVDRWFEALGYLPKRTTAASAN